VNLLIIQLYGEFNVIVFYELTVPFQCYDSYVTKPLWNSIIWWFPYQARRNNIHNIGETDCELYASPTFPLICPLQSILYVVAWIIKVPVFLCMLFYIAISNLILFTYVSLSNSELSHTLQYLKQNITVFTLGFFLTLAKPFYHLNYFHSSRPMLCLLCHLHALKHFESLHFTM